MMSISQTMDAGVKVQSSLASPDIRIVRDYPHPRAKLWRALTEPELVRRWMMRPEGFEPVVGNRFKLMAKPQPGWRGFVECEVLEAVQDKRLRYSWVGDPSHPPMDVVFDLSDIPGGTRLSFTHTGFAGVGGYLLSKLMMGPGWKKMFAKTLATLLDAMRDDGTLRPGSDIAPKF
jgi:uncharacterized protein YndB with AHSA1/START domain